MNGEFMKQKWLLGLGCGLCILVIILFILFTPKHKEDVVFLLNKDKAKETHETINFGDKVDLHPSSMHLKAMQGDKDVTNQVTYRRVNFNQLRTYKIIYQYEGKQFIRNIKVVDKVNPIITGKAELDMECDESFNKSLLDLQAEDNFDGDITSNIIQEGEISTKVAGDFLIRFSITDSSGNQGIFESVIHVREKHIINRQPENNIVVVSNPNDVTVLINKQQILPDGWAPTDLVSIGNGLLLRSVAANSWQSMMSAAASDGIRINAVSAYRTQAYQTNLYNRYYASDPNNAPFYSALPRRSEHELGLALDISNGDYQLHYDLADTDAGRWLSVHAQDFGWVLRYPANKSDVTGYIFEAWHYRYVGVSLAKELTSSGITLDEY